MPLVWRDEAAGSGNQATLEVVKGGMPPLRYVQEGTGLIRVPGHYCDHR